jgi:outer membrane protein OmpA-like peptidoglycan-associated protein
MGSSTLTLEHKKQLDALCGLIKDKSRHAIIEGFTDDIGGIIYNQRLSEKRASSITQYLKQCGLESEDSIGKGIFPIDQIQSDMSEQNKRKLSRKVTIRLIIKV